MPRGVRRGRPSAIARLTTAQLKRELERREKLAVRLQARRSRIAQGLAAVVAAIRQLGGMPTRSGSRQRPRRTIAKASRRAGRRAHNEFPLHLALHKVLRGRTLGIKEMMAAVKRAGFKSKSKSFRTTVSVALATHRKLFKRVSRGQYTAR